MRTQFIHLFKLIMLFCLFSSVTVYGAGVEFKIKGKEAKKIYKAMTAIEEDGAAGHMYRKGKSILCSYTIADMDDENGHNLSNEDPRRYTCSMHFNKHGFATPRIT